jgi:hypothetical protein
MAFAGGLSFRQVNVDCLAMNLEVRNSGNGSKAKAGKGTLTPDPEQILHKYLI